MSRLANAGLLGLVSICGVATVYVTFQPPLKEVDEARHHGQDFTKQHSPPEEAVAQQRKDSQISTAIFDDIKEAGREVDKAGFAWGIREAIWGPGKYSPQRRRKDGSEGKQVAVGDVVKKEDVREAETVVEKKEG